MAVKYVAMDSYDAHPSTGASSAGPAAPPPTRAEERQPGALARRAALTFAASGAALAGVAVARHRAPDESAVDQVTRHPGTERGRTGMSQAAAATTAAPGASRSKAGHAAAPNRARAKVEYQTPAAGKAPKPPVAPTVKQPATVLSIDPAVHLARRATWGPTAATVRQIRTMGAAKWLEWQLEPSSIPDPLVATYLQEFDTLGATTQDLQSRKEEFQKVSYFYPHDQLEAAAIVRAAWSERQLFEVVVDFFHSRLHVPAHIQKTRDSLNHYDAAVIRKHAFGTFKDMLWAMITHPAMIVYLDNQNNTKYGGNQNLARELLELHTLGVDAGFKQADVSATALLLTGLSVDRNGAMVYLPDQHQTGAVKVFGTRYVNAGAAGGLATIKSLVTNLARNPKTAHSLALDLARRFVSDAPPKKLVDRLAAVYLKNDTAIVPVLRALFASPEFTHSVGQKYRRPLEHAVATMRVLGLRRADAAQFMPSLGDLRQRLDVAGQAPLGRVSPDGYPDFARPWLSSSGIVGRWNLGMSLVAGWGAGFTPPDVSKIFAGATPYGAAVDKLFLALTFQKPSAATRRALLTFIGQQASAKLTPQARNGDHRLRVQLPALILGGPEHQLR
jgi:uncharacterized protein (DUF1800 family)